MRTLRITLAYDGGRYVGWQRQENGPSVQGVVEHALEAIEGRAIAATGAGRTDAGVHALGQVASFRMAHGIATPALVRALNARLPEDIRVLAAAEAPDDFNARFAAREKTYRYRILNRTIDDPFERRYSWHVPRALDFEAVTDALAVVEGRHDFAAFQAAGSDVASTVRTIVGVSAQQTAWSPLRGPVDPALGDVGGVLTLEFRGEGFLRHMVRVIVGSVVQVGLGRRRPEWMHEVLAGRDRRLAGPTAPAAGLFLVAVRFVEAPVPADVPESRAHGSSDSGRASDGRPEADAPRA